MTKKSPCFLVKSHEIHQKSTRNPPEIHQKTRMVRLRLLPTAAALPGSGAHVEAAASATWSGYYVSDIAR